MRPDVNHKQSRQRPTIKRRAPAEMRKDQPVNDRREQKTKGVTLLQNPGGQPAGLRRQGFHRERGAQSPLAAHPNAVERAEDEKDGVVRRKRGQQFHH